MEKKLIDCPNCKMPVKIEDEKCPFCGHDLAEAKAAHVAEQAAAEEVAKKPAKTEKTHAKPKLFQILYYVATGLAILVFLIFCLPGAGNATGSIYEFTFGSPTMDSGSAAEIGTNAGTITFLFAVLGILMIAAVLWSIHKKTAEVGLFTYFGVFMYLVNAIVSFCSSLILSSGTAVDSFTIGIGFIILGIFSLGICGVLIAALVFYKRFLVENPLENFKVSAPESSEE